MHNMYYYNYIYLMYTLCSTVVFTSIFHCSGMCIILYSACVFNLSGDCVFFSHFTDNMDDGSRCSSSGEVEGVVFRDAVKQMLISRPPPVLCLHLKRCNVYILRVSFRGL